jgi:hypothetical protein
VSAAWLPPLVLLADHGGDWKAYGATLYGWFKKDFLESVPTWPGKRVVLKCHPLIRGKEATFWHFLTTGEDEQAKNLDISRCERIRWPRPTMEAFTNSHPLATDRVVWWQNERKRQISYLIALPDFSYLFVVRDRGDYVLPWTQYVVQEAHRRQKLREEYEAYWQL